MYLLVSSVMDESLSLSQGLISGLGDDLATLGFFSSWSSFSSSTAWRFLVLCFERATAVTFLSSSVLSVFKPAFLSWPLFTVVFCGPVFVQSSFRKTCLKCFQLTERGSMFCGGRDLSMKTTLCLQDWPCIPRAKKESKEQLKYCWFKRCVLTPRLKAWFSLLWNHLQGQGSATKKLFNCSMAFYCSSRSMVSIM